MKKELITEYLGTFMLVLVGTGAIVVNQMYAGVIGHFGIATAFGLVVVAVIYTYGSVSGAHINPAVSIAFYLAGRFPGNQLLPYIVAQCLGALTASLLIKLCFPGNKMLGATALSVHTLAGFIIEFLMSWWLMTVILRVSRGAKEEGIVAGLIIGSVVAIEALVGGPLTGASMNPARSIGPALMSANLAELWLYILAPIGGMSLAVYTCSLVSGQDCCVSQPTKLAVK